MANLSLIKTLAESRHISIAELSAKIGITEQQLHGIVRKNSTKINTLEKIAEILDVPVSYFFEEAPLTCVVKTEGDFSPASKNGNVSVNVGDAVLLERIKSLEAQLVAKDEIIKAKDALIDKLINLH